MSNDVKTTIKFPSSTNELLETLLTEIHLLRNEMSLFFGEDELENYSHPNRIKHSYQEALKQYPIKS